LPNGASANAKQVGTYSNLANNLFASSCEALPNDQFEWRLAMNGDSMWVQLLPFAIWLVITIIPAISICKRVGKTQQPLRFLLRQPSPNHLLRHSPLTIKFVAFGELALI
jgi:hypothetical protein